MRVKKDKSYVVVSVSKGYIQGAFPYTEEGKQDAEDYKDKLVERTGERYKVKVA